MSTPHNPGEHPPPGPGPGVPPRHGEPTTPLPGHAMPSYAGHAAQAGPPRAGHPGPPPPAGPQARKSKRWLPWLVGVATATMLLCCGGVVALSVNDDDDPDPDPPAAAPSVAEPSVAASRDPAAPTHPPPADDAPPPADNAPPPAEGLGDGTWLVPADVKPGTYHTTVPEDSIGCYWQRAKSAEGDLDSILANDNVEPGGHVIVTIAKTDQAFKTDGCGEWTPAPRSGSKAATIGSGTWAVGVNIVAGTYAATVPADSSGCYWQRMRNFAGDLNSIIANENLNPGARATVTIRSSDKGFKSSGCGTWRRR